MNTTPTAPYAPQFYDPNLLLKAEIERAAGYPTTRPWGDKSDRWSDRIAAAHPLRTGDNDTYGVAMEMIGNRRSKAALVELVNWMLKGQP